MSTPLFFLLNVLPMLLGIASYQFPASPLVLFPTGCKIQALIDTGSMMSIINSRVFQCINEMVAYSKQPPSIIRNISNPCVSIKGQLLHSSFSISASHSLPGSSFMHQGEFLVCDNVLSPLDCIFCWDFLTSN